MIQKLLSSMKVLLASRSREVIKATLGFIKVWSIRIYVCAFEMCNDY